jgi:hypothetical protein
MANAARRPATKNAAANGVIAVARAAIRAARVRVSVGPATVYMGTALSRCQAPTQTHRRYLSTTLATLQTDLVVLTIRTWSVMSLGDSAARARASVAWGHNFAVQDVCLLMGIARLQLPQHQNLEMSVLVRLFPCVFMSSPLTNNL